MDHMGLFRIVSPVPCYIAEFPFTLGLDVDGLQVNATVIIEDHNESPAWYKFSHHESSVLWHLETVKAQERVVAVMRLDPELIRSQPGNSPVFEFCRRENNTCGDGGFESPRHLI